jgi:hypothetical protein
LNGWRLKEDLAQSRAQAFDLGGGIYRVSHAPHRRAAVQRCLSWLLSHLWFRRMKPWRFVRCESWPCSDYEVAHNMWLYAMELARERKQSEIIRIRTHRNGNGIAEMRRRAMAKGAGDKPVPYFLGVHCDVMRRQVKQFFAAWIRVK